VSVQVFDTETCLFRPGVMAPEMVCISHQRPGEGPQLIHANDPRTLPLVTSWLESDALLVGQHVCYDLAVVAAWRPHLVPLIFRKYDRGQITCTKIRQQLLDIAGGEFRGRFHEYHKDIELTPDELAAAVAAQQLSFQRGEIGHVEQITLKRKVKAARWIPHKYDLEDLCYRHTGRRLEKDIWRLRYGEFLNVPIERWPEGARLYPLEDARATLDVFLSQEVHAQFIPNQFHQAMGAWALHLEHTWGLRTHGASVDKLEKETIEALANIEDGLKDVGLVRSKGKKAGTRDTKVAKARMISVCAQKGMIVRLTDKGGVCLDSDACEATEDHILEDYAELTSLKAMLSKDIPALQSGTVFPVHTSYGLAASGRSTSSKPNVQNPKRKNEIWRNGVMKYRLPDVRECFVPRQGKVFAQADFSAMELCTLAQVCISLFGFSALGDALNAGIDPHTDFACSILGISYEEGVQRKKANEPIFDDRRQTAKVANFGFPGGLGAESLVLYARKSYNVTLTEERAKALKVAWLARWPEMRLFFQYVGNLINQDTGLGAMQTLFSNRWRGGTHYTALCNGFFQSLAADAAKWANYLVSRACYAEPQSVMFGSRPVNFVHDEVFAEVDDDEYAHDKAVELSRIMIAGANLFLPDVPAKAEPLLARCWSKKAKAIFDSNKRLIPWSPEIMKDWKKGMVYLYDDKGRQMIPEAA
jgi:hypothetical protein